MSAEDDISRQPPFLLSTGSGLTTSQRVQPAPSVSTSSGVSMSNSDVLQPTLYTSIPGQLAEGYISAQSPFQVLADAQAQAQSHLSNAVQVQRRLQAQAFLRTSAQAFPGQVTNFSSQLDAFANPATSTAAAVAAAAACGTTSSISSKKPRKPYVITKNRENWTPEEHQVFLDALKTHGRDWKQIEGCVKTKNVIQIRSHAQKYFLKVQKNNTGEHVPPPRPKRKSTAPASNVATVPSSNLLAAATAAGALPTASTSMIALPSTVSDPFSANPYTLQNPLLDSQPAALSSSSAHTDSMVGSGANHLDIKDSDKAANTSQKTTTSLQDTSSLSASILAIQYALGVQPAAEHDNASSSPASGISCLEQSTSMDRSARAALPVDCPPLSSIRRSLSFPRNMNRGLKRPPTTPPVSIVAKIPGTDPIGVFKRRLHHDVVSSSPRKPSARLTGRASGSSDSVFNRRHHQSTPNFSKIYRFFASIFDPQIRFDCSDGLNFAALTALDKEIIKLLIANLETNISNVTFRCQLIDTYRQQLSLEV